MPLGRRAATHYQAMLKVFLNVAVFGMAPQATIGRRARPSYPGSFEPHEYHAESCASSAASPPRWATPWPARATRS
jgi:hypothetical protein